MRKSVMQISRESVPGPLHLGEKVLPTKGCSWCVSETKKPMCYSTVSEKEGSWRRTQSGKLGEWRWKKVGTK